MSLNTDLTCSVLVFDQTYHHHHRYSNSQSANPATTHPCKTYVSVCASVAIETKLVVDVYSKPGQPQEGTVRQHDERGILILVHDQKKSIKHSTKHQLSVSFISDNLSNFNEPCRLFRWGRGLVHFNGNQETWGLQYGARILIQLALLSLAPGFLVS